MTDSRRVNSDSVDHKTASSIQHGSYCSFGDGLTGRTFDNVHWFRTAGPRPELREARLNGIQLILPRHCSLRTGP